MGWTGWAGGEFQTRFNLSEQMRSCILLLESKWERKRLELQLDFDEHMIWANEELLRQVWINLLDNAIKFAPEGHTVRVGISEDPQCVRVTVRSENSVTAFTVTLPALQSESGAAAH